MRMLSLFLFLLIFLLFSMVGLVCSNHFLILLLFFEYFMLMTYVMLFTNFILSNTSFLLLVLFVLMIIEAALGLTILVGYSKKSGSEYLHNYFMV